MIAHKTDRIILPLHCEAKENTIEIQLLCFIFFPPRKNLESINPFDTL